MSDGLLLPIVEAWPAAVQAGAGAISINFDLPATSSAEQDLIVGSNQSYPVLRFPDATAAYVRRWTRLPDDLYVAAGLALRLLWSTPASAGNARWTTETAYVMPIDGDQDDLDPTFNAADAVTTPAATNAGRLILSEFTALDPTGLRPGALFLLQIGRDPDHVDDDLGDDVHLISVELVYQRLVILP